MPTAADLAVIRQWCGSDVGAPGDQVDANDIDDRIARLGSAHAAALEVLRTRRTDMVVNPSKYSVDGDFAQDTVANLKAIDALIGDLETIVATDAGTGTTSTSLMVRRNERAFRCR